MDRELLAWILLLGLGFPFAALLLGEVAERLERSQSALSIAIRKTTNYVLPPLALLLVMLKLLEVANTANSARLVETVTWVAVVAASIAFINAIFTTSDRTSRWQLRVPSLFFQVARAVTVLTIGLHVVGGVWAVDLSGIVTAVGVSSLVIALALQDTLSNLVSGLLLLVSRPFEPGDWITFDEVEGRVIEQNWWGVTLEYTEWEKRITVPNGALAQATVENFGSDGFWHSVEVEFSYNDPPNQVLAALKRLNQDFKEAGLDQFSYDPELRVGIQELGESGITYVVWYKRTADKKEVAFKNYFFSRIYYMAQREGFTIPYPIGMNYEIDPEEGMPRKIPQAVVSRASEISTYLRKVSCFQSLEGSEIDVLAEKATVQQYGYQEVIVQEGKPDKGFYILLKGRGRVLTRNGDGERSGVYFLGPGDVFGEMALFPGEVSPVTVVVEEDVELILIGIDDIVQLIQSRSNFGFEMIQFIEGRKRALQLAKGISEAHENSRNGHQAIEVNL